MTNLNEIDQIRSFVKFINDAKSAIAYNESRIRELDDETQDILHDLELNGHKFNEYGHLAKALGDVRRERRLCKEENERLKPLVESIDAPQIGRLTSAQGHIKKIMEIQQSRIYTPKVRK